MSIRSVLGQSTYRGGEVFNFIADHVEWGAPGTRRLAFYSPGYTVGVSGMKNGFGSKQIIDLLIEQGYAVLIGDFGGTATFGNDAAIQAIGQALTWITTPGTDSQCRGTRPVEVLLVGTSMGFMDFMAWARVNQSKVLGAVALTGGVNLASTLTINDPAVPNIVADVNAAYGGAYVPATHDAAHSPIVFASELQFPIISFYASDDNLVTPVDSLAFAAAAHDTSIYNLGALGHDNDALFAAAARPELKEFISSL